TGKLERRIGSENPFIKTDDVHALAVLRHPCRGVDYFIEDDVVEFFQSSLDDGPRATCVMTLEVLDVLQKDDRGASVLYDCGEVKEQIALILVLEAVSMTKASLLRDSCQRERLAWKSRRKHVMRRDVLRFDLADVTGRCLPVPGAIRLLRILVPFRGVDARAAEFLECGAETADAGEEVAEPEWDRVRNELLRPANGSKKREVTSLKRLLQDGQHELLLCHAVLPPLAVDP